MSLLRAKTSHLHANACKQRFFPPFEVGGDAGAGGGG